MKFQILNEEGNALSMGELDKEAAEFFGVPYDEERYASPAATLISWYDVVGHNIARSKKEMLSWSDIVAQILQICTICTSTMEHLERSIEAYRPFISLCYYWKSKGYTPISL